MAETTADVRRDIEMTRERISTTLAQLERKTNVVQIVKDHPWPSLATAVGVGVLLSGSRADVKAATATVAATRGASSRVGGLLDDVVANLMGGLHQAVQGKLDSLLGEVHQALGLPPATSQGGRIASGLADGGRGGASLLGNLPASGTDTRAASGSWAPQTPATMSGGANSPAPTTGNGQAGGAGPGYQPARAD